MRVIATCIVALGLVATSAIAGTTASGDKETGPAAAAATTASQPESSPSVAPATAANASTPTKAEESSMESELQQMRELLDAQTKQLQEQQEKMQLLEEKLNASSSAAPAADPTADASAAQPNQDKGNAAPTSINIKGITLTPGGFMAAEAVWRQKALAADVNTPFSSAPFNGSPNAHTSEFQASGRQSRISMLVEGKLADVKIGGYYETDFLSAGTTSTPTESNSYTMRQRQFWGQAAFTNGFTFTGGQQWSLITETTHGMDNRTEALPMTIDAQYNVGFSWARQFGARFTYDWNNKVWLGVSLEQSTPTLTVHGNPTAQAAATPLCTNAGCTTTTTVNTSATFNNFLLGAFGTSSGLYNPLGNYGYNEAPDFVVKAVFEPGFGHYEIFGIAGVVRGRGYPCVPEASSEVVGPNCPAGVTSPTSAAGAFNDSATTGGIGGNARWSVLAKKVDVGVHFLGGTGIGRYGSGTLSDLTVRPNGTVVPIHNYQALGTLQFHPTPKLDIYMNVGGEYEARTAYEKPGATSPNEGYGYLSLSNSGCWTETLPVAAPATNGTVGSVPTGVGGSNGFIPGPLGSCTGDTRNLIEGTLGFWYRFYNGPKGRVQYGMQYSNYIRNTWRGAGGSGIAASGQPHSDENMIFTSFRYYLP